MNKSPKTYQIIFTFFLVSFSILPSTQAKRHRIKDMRCIRALRNTGIRFKIGPWLKGMKTPVTILNGRVRSLLLKNGNKTAKPVMDCRTALALYYTVPIFRANGGIKYLIVGNFYSYRLVKNTSRLSHHAMGLAMDLYGIVTDNGKRYMVLSDYGKNLGSGRTCEGHAKNRGARLLRQLVCDLDRSHYFSAILTPDSDREHQDHIHISVYPAFKRRTRKHRTVLIEPQHFGKRWVKIQPKRGYPSKARVRRIVRQRRRANRRLIRQMRRARLRKIRKRRKKHKKSSKRKRHR